MTPEGKIQSAAIRYAKSCGLKVRRNHMGPGAETGWPDVEFLPGGGYVFFIEFKAPGESPTPRQQLVMAELIQRGYDVHVCYSFEDAKQVIDGWVDRLDRPC
jgi:hypothetical protein